MPEGKRVELTAMGPSTPLVFMFQPSAAALEDFTFERPLSGDALPLLLP